MNDFEFQELERKGLIEAFDLKEDEVFEARHNLLGAFMVLYKIDERLRREAEEKSNEESKKENAEL
jgi:hypothetical protein